MSRRLLIDTDVLIDYLRGLPAAGDFLEEQANALVVSAINVAELFAGAKNGAEHEALRRFLQAFEVVDVDQQIAERGGLIRRDSAPAHGTGLADALIAATAEAVGAALVTLNRKHFPMLQDVLVPYAK